MTDDTLPFPTTDAMEWVRAFRETFPDANVDDGTMLGWFANAIEHGRGPAVTALDEEPRTDVHVHDYGVAQIPCSRPECARPAAALARPADRGPRLIELPPVDDDNRCTGCGALVKRDGSCKCKVTVAQPFLGLV